MCLGACGVYVLGLWYVFVGICLMEVVVGVYADVAKRFTSYATHQV